MSVSRCLGALALLAMGTLSFGACSSGGAEPEPEAVGSVNEGIGWSCTASAPSRTVIGGFGVRYTSAATYSDCFKGKVVEIDNYRLNYAVGGYTKVSWAEAAPATQADCANSTVGAYLARWDDPSQSWVRVVAKGAHGEWPNDGIDSDIDLPPKQPNDAITGPLQPLPKDPGLFGPITKVPFNRCTPPAVYFYGDDMRSGTYKIIASARLNGTELHSVAFTSVAGTCGATEGAQCCNGGLQCTPFSNCNPATNRCDGCGTPGQACCSDTADIPGGCALDSNCKSSKCVACGGPGQACCTYPDTNPVQTYCDDRDTCSTRTGKCEASCGRFAGDRCCPSGIQCSGSATCDAASQICKSGTVTPPVNPPVNPPVTPTGPSCYAEGHGCTPGRGSGCCQAITKDLTCNPLNSLCASNPNDSPTHRATNCDEPGDPCCADLGDGPFGGLGGCDPVFYKSLHCGSDGTCAQ